VSVTEDVLKESYQPARPSRSADKAIMESGHHFPLVGALGIDHVECVLDLLKVPIRGAETMVFVEAVVADFIRIWNDKELHAGDRDAVAKFIIGSALVLEKAAFPDDETTCVWPRAPSHPSPRTLSRHPLDAGASDVVALNRLGHALTIDPPPAVADHLVPVLDICLTTIGLRSSAMTIPETVIRMRGSRKMRSRRKPPRRPPYSNAGSERMLRPPAAACTPNVCEPLFRAVVAVKQLCSPRLRRSARSARQRALCPAIADRPASCRSRSGPEDIERQSLSLSK
jgi:hypothetical protein